MRVEKLEGAIRGSINGGEIPSMEVGMIVDESPSNRDGKIIGEKSSKRANEEKFGIKRA